MVCKLMGAYYYFIVLTILIILHTVDSFYLQNTHHYNSFDARQNHTSTLQFMNTSQINHTAYPSHVNHTTQITNTKRPNTSQINNNTFLSSQNLDKS